MGGIKTDIYRGKPAAVPRLIPETEEECREWEAGQRRHELRAQRRRENY